NAINYSEGKYLASIRLPLRGGRLIVLARNLNGNNILLLPLLPTNRFFADNEPQRDVEQSCR
ncbi:hypothetical protein MBS12_005642, partial [Klebsiella pneumoniae]